MVAAILTVMMSPISIRSARMPSCYESKRKRQGRDDHISQCSFHILPPSPVELDKGDYREGGSYPKDKKFVLIKGLSQKLASNSY